MSRLRKLVKRALVLMSDLGGPQFVYMKRRAQRICTICDYQGNFEPFGGYYIRPDAKCRNCGSLERHRLLRLFLDAEPDLFSESAACLHIAPELCVRRFLEPKAKRYETADLFDEDVDHNWNIEDIDCADNGYDVVVCSHVLEHVKTTKALAEFFRVLRPNGVALLMVPICEGLDQTYENNEVSTDQGRWEHFQQPDHVRVLGRDFRQMIRDAGFQLAEFVAEGENAVRYGLVMGERVFVAKKRAS